MFVVSDLLMGGEKVITVLEYNILEICIYG